MCAEPSQFGNEIFLFTLLRDIGFLTPEYMKSTRFVIKCQHLQRLQVTLLKGNVEEEGVRNNENSC